MALLVPSGLTRGTPVSWRSVASVACVVAGSPEAGAAGVAEPHVFHPAEGWLCLFTWWWWQCSQDEPERKLQGLSGSGVLNLHELVFETICWPQQDKSQPRFERCERRLYPSMGFAANAVAIFVICHVQERPQSYGPSLWNFQSSCHSRGLSLGQLLKVY